MNRKEKNPARPDDRQEPAGSTPTEHDVADVMHDSDNERPRTASDVCDEWCWINHEDYPDERIDHDRILQVLELWGSNGLEGVLSVSLRRPYVEGLPLSTVKDRHTRVTIGLGDDPAVLSMPSAVARSLAAALLRAADRDEGAS